MIQKESLDFSGTRPKLKPDPLSIPRYVRYRKKHLDGVDITQIAWVPEIEEKVKQRESLAKNAVEIISDIEKMLFVPPEKDFREFLENTVYWVDRWVCL